VTDFVEHPRADIEDPTGELSADEERSAWFHELAAIRHVPE